MQLPVKYELDGLHTWARIFSSNSPAFPAAAGAAGGAAVAALGGLFSFWTRTHVAKSVYRRTLQLQAEPQTIPYPTDTEQKKKQQTHEQEYSTSVIQS